MTILVGIIDQQKESAYLYADTKVSLGDHSCPTDVTKIIDYKFLTVCSCGALRGINVLEAHLNPPHIGPDEDTYQYMLTKFIPSLIVANEIGGTLIHEEGLMAPNSYIVAIDGRLFSIGNDFSLMEYREYVADGCGAPYAYGALYASKNIKSVKKRAETAIKAASEFDPGCGRQINYIERPKLNREKIRNWFENLADKLNKEILKDDPECTDLLTGKQLVDVGVDRNGNVLEYDDAE